MNNKYTPSFKALNKCIDSSAKRIQKRIDNGSLKFSLLDNGIDIDIREELAASVSLLTDTSKYELFKFIGFSYTDTEVDKLMDDKVFLNLEDYAILRSSSIASDIHIRVAVYTALRDNSRYCGDILATILVYTIWSLANRVIVRLPEFDLEHCTLPTILYWARENELIDMCTVGGAGINGLTHAILGNCTSYRDVLVKNSKALGEDYYEFKHGRLRKEDLVSKLVTSGGALPLPRNSELVACPEYSWRAVGDIIGEKSLYGIDVPDEYKEAVSYILQLYYHSMYVCIGNVYPLIMQGLFYMRNKRNIHAKLTTLEMYKRKYEESEETTRKLKSKFKEMMKEVKAISKETMALKNELTIRDKMESEIRAKGIVDITPYEKEIANKNEEIEELKSELDRVSRLLHKKEKHILDIEESNSSMKSEIALTSKRNKKLKETVGGLLDKGSGDIPVEVLVKSICDKKIVIFGGDMLHNNLKALGFNNLRLMTANEKSMDCFDLRNADAVVIITSYLSHSSLAIPKMAADRYGVPIMYFHSKGVNGLCRELFTFLNSDKAIRVKAN